MVDAADVLMDCDASVFESVDAILMILPVILVLVDVGSPENLVLASDAMLPVDDCTVVVPLGLLVLVRLVEELLVSAWYRGLGFHNIIGGILGGAHLILQVVHLFAGAGEIIGCHSFHHLN